MAFLVRDGGPEEFGSVQAFPQSSCWVYFQYCLRLQCVAYNCGQGAIAIFMLGPIWIVALFTIASAAFAYRKFAR